MYISECTLCVCRSGSVCDADIPVVGAFVVTVPSRALQSIVSGSLFNGPKMNSI